MPGARFRLATIPLEELRLSYGVYECGRMKYVNGLRKTARSVTVRSCSTSVGKRLWVALEGVLVPILIADTYSGAEEMLLDPADVYYLEAVGDDTLVRLRSQLRL